MTDTAEPETDAASALPPFDADRARSIMQDINTLLDLLPSAVRLSMTGILVGDAALVAARDESAKAPASMPDVLESVKWLMLGTALKAATDQMNSSDATLTETIAQAETLEDAEGEMFGKIDEVERPAMIAFADRNLLMRYALYLQNTQQMTSGVLTMAEDTRENTGICVLWLGDGGSDHGAYMARCQEQLEKILAGEAARPEPGSFAQFIVE